MSNPRVYVGTYGKYNRGSIAGGWISLLECKDYADFLRKCRALHRGERDPEFMIQDTEDFPDGLSCMESLSEQEFKDVVQACKEEDEQEQSSIADLLRAALLIRLSGKAQANPAMYKAWLDEYAATDPNWSDYYKKHNVGAVKMHDRYYLLEKPHMENQFWFHDEGPNYEFYCSLNTDEKIAEYFKKENLNKYDRLISDIEEGSGYDHDKRLWWQAQEDGERLFVYTSTQKSYNRSNSDDCYTLFTDEEKAVLLAALKWGRAQFEKRLDTYLKRYGVSKIHMDTFWADR